MFVQIVRDYINVDHVRSVHYYPERTKAMAEPGLPVRGAIATITMTDGKEIQVNGNIQAKIVRDYFESISICLLVSNQEAPSEK